MDGFHHNVKRGEGPFYGRAKKLARTIIAPKVARLPEFLRGPLRFLYEMHFAVITLWNAFWNLSYRYPLFQGRCASMGSNVTIDRLPYVTGPVQIHVGNYVWIGGNVQIMSGHLVGTPRFILHDHAEISWNVQITVNREIIIEEFARISWNCNISDSDGHPRQADLRAQNAPVNPRDIRPVRICRNAWIGNGSYIMKGVTIGEGAVIGANSVVISDIPPYSLALGNPAEVVIRNYGRPQK